MPLSGSELEQLRALASLREHQFRSRIPLIGPLIARFRELWNNVSTRWYVLPLILQQSEINRRLIEVLAIHEANIREVEARLTSNEAKAQWINYEPELIEIRSRLINCEATLRALETRLADHDGWLIAQDREQSATIGDLNEVTLRLIRTIRRLDELERRLDALEVSREKPGA